MTNQTTPTLEQQIFFAEDLLDARTGLNAACGGSGSFDEEIKMLQGVVETLRALVINEDSEQHLTNVEPCPYVLGKNFDKDATYAIKAYEQYCDYIAINDGVATNCIRYRPFPNHQRESEL